MLALKTFKIKGPRLAKNAFPEISARIKMSQHVALLFNLGVLKNCLLALGGNCPLCPLAPASYYPVSGV